MREGARRISVARPLHLRPMQDSNAATRDVCAKGCTDREGTQLKEGAEGARCIYRRVPADAGHRPHAHTTAGDGRASGWGGVGEWERVSMHAYRTIAVRD